MTSVRAARILAGLRAAGGTEPLAERVCTACTAATGVDGAGLSLAGGRGTSAVVAATAGLGRAVEELQVQFGEGPCADALRTGAPAVHADLRRTAPRWPALGPAALQAGARAAFAVPVTVGAVRLGPLRLFRARAEGLARAQVDEALAHADAAGSVLLEAGPGRPGDADGGTGTLGRAVHANRHVHQATGMVSEQLRVGPEEALARLRAHAYAHQRAVVDVARDVVGRRLRFSAEDL